MSLNRCRFVFRLSGSGVIFIRWVLMNRLLSVLAFVMVSIRLRM